MITAAIAVIVVGLWWGISRGHLSVSSLIVGCLAGLVFASTTVGAPIAKATQTSATAIGVAVQNAFSGVIK